jgi:hypothetical protein
MTCEITEPFRGDSRRAMDFVMAALTAAGFRIEKSNDTTLSATAPMMMSTRQNPLLGASRLEIAISGGSLTARADLTGARRLFQILGVMMVAMMAIGETATILLVSLHKYHGRTPGRLVEFIPLMALSPWPILLPLMYQFTKRNARRAVQTLLHNAAMASQ